MKRTYNASKVLNYHDLIGLEEVKTNINSIVRNIKYQKACNTESTRNWHVFAFIGGHGTCKKTTARSIAHELFKLNAITKDSVEIIRLADLDIKKKKLNEKLNSFEGVLYIRDSQSLEQRFSFTTSIDALFDFLETNNPSITVIIEFVTEYSFNKVMAQNARFCEFLREDIINRPLHFDYCYTAEQTVDVLQAMADHSKQIPEISFRHAVDMNRGFTSLVLKIFDGIIKEKGGLGVEAATIKEFFISCVDQFICNRTHFSERTKLYLETKDDIPVKYRRYLDESIRIPKEELCFFPYCSALKDDLIERIKRCVVFVEGYRRNSTIPVQSTGTIITKTGFVLVCHHCCIAECDFFRCRVYTPGAVGGDYAWFDAKLCTTDSAAEYDQALLKLDGTNFPCVSLMDEGECTSLNEEMIVIGYPMGESLCDRAEMILPSIVPTWVASVQKKHGIDTYYLGGIIGHGGMSGAPVVNRNGKLVCIIQGQQRNSSNMYENGMVFATAPNLDAFVGDENQYTLDISTDELPF